MAELVIQLEETYGEGAISVDDIFANPVVDKIAALLPGGAAEAGKAAVIAAPAPPSACCARQGQGCHCAVVD